MRKLKHLIKLFAVNITIISMLQTSFVMTSAHAGVTGEDIQNLSNVALGAYSSFLGQKQQMIQQQISTQKNAQLMQKLSPSCRNPDGTYCYQSPGKFFPECPLPATMSTIPQNVCSETITDPSQSANQLASMITYESIAKGWVNYYDQMSNEATNVAYPAGLKCLTDRTKKLDSEMIEMINNLTRLQDQLNKDKEIFKANNKKLLEELTQTNDELLGSTKNNLAVKTTPISNYFSASCQAVITSENLKEGNVKGLLAIQQIVAPLNKSAAEYNQNRTAIEAEIRSDINKFQNAIASGGLEDFINSKFNETSKIESLKEAAGNQVIDFNLAKARIAKELIKIGYEIPTMDKNFSIDFNEFLSGSSSFFKKTYINDCVTGKDKTGMAISTDQILNSLQQKSTDSRGTARDKYKAALGNILNSDSFIDDKLNQIRALEKTYSDISITYQNSSGQRVTETPYDLYVKTIEKCEQRYALDDTFSATGVKGVSQKKKVERGQALLRELKSLHDNYSSNLSTKVLDKVLSCGGESKKAGSTCASPESLNYLNKSFCMSHANQCANEINGCYAEATNVVEKKKARMNALAKTFNANADLMVKRSNQLYDLQKANVMQMIKLIQGRFPGTNFAIPANMFVSMPELKKDTYGIDLASDGNMAFMDELPKKIDLLKKIFQDQQTNVAKEVSAYIDSQRNAMAKQTERWSGLADQCRDAISNVTKDLAKINAEGKKQQAEIDQKTGTFCRKYDKMTQNPLGACNGADQLAEDSDQIASRLTNDALKYTEKFRNLCSSYNNEAESTVPEYCRSEREGLSANQLKICKLTADADEKSAKKGNKKSKNSKNKIRFSSLCKDKTIDDKTFIKAANEKIPEADRDFLKDVATFEDIDRKLDEMESSTSEFFSKIMTLRPDDKKPICEQLVVINGYSVSQSDTKESIDEKFSENEIRINKSIAAEKAKTPVGDTSSLDKELIAAQKKRDEQKKKIELQDALASLEISDQPDEDVVVERLSRIGEQADGSCDAQASNTNTPKDWGSNLLKSFDSAILGTTK